MVNVCAAGPVFVTVMVSASLAGAVKLAADSSCRDLGKNENAGS